MVTARLRPADDAARVWLPLVVVLFVGSGAAALIYEIVWFQLLQLVIGSSAVSLGVLLGTFMGGMCLGSIGLPRLVSSRHHPLQVYAALELGIGVIGLAVIFGLPWLDNAYAAIATGGWTGVLIRGLIAAICLLPPTVLMGATLPAVARWVKTTPHGIAWLGFFYGGNIAGAVFGCLLAGFYLLRVYDMVTATYVAVAINVVVAAVAYSMARVLPAAVADESPLLGAALAGAPNATSADVSLPARRPSYAIYVVIALSGMAALGAEVVWTRLLSLMIGGSVYTFSIILAVFLMGLGVGSSLGAAIGQRMREPSLALGMCQLLLTGAVAWAAYQLACSLPYWPIDPGLVSSPWHSFQLDVLRCLWAVLPAAVLWGASFPLALASVAGHEQDSGRLVGGVYAANTVGAILGALGFSMLVVGSVGTQDAQRIVIGLAAVGALLAMVPPLWRESFATRSSEEPSGAARRWASGVGLLAAMALVGWLVRSIPETPGDLIAYGRYVPSQAGRSTIIYQGEGLNASVAVSLEGENVRSFHVSGKVEASSIPQDMRLQRMLGHIPALVHPQPKSVLVVGCGAGVTAGSFLVHPDVERLVICEIEPLIPQVVAQHFAEENYNVVNDPRVEIVYDDARHYVLTCREKFDIITSDPIHPWVKGAATLYTREYFEMCKSRLKPGGIITQWVPLYESNEAAVKSELATFFEVFPEGTIWSNDDRGIGYDIVLLGTADAPRIDVDQLQDRLHERPDYAQVAWSLEEVGFLSVFDLLATYAGTGADLKPWLADAEINRDRNLRLQYLAGMGSSHYREAAILDQMLIYRRFPENLFACSDMNRVTLKYRLGFAQGQP